MFFDHYRMKLEALEAQAAKTGQQSERLMRNKTKFATAKNNFDSANKRTSDLIATITEQCDKVIVNLTIKFTKELQLRWYSEMQTVFSGMEKLEQEMMEIADSESCKYKNMPKFDASQSLSNDPYGF